MNAFAKTALPVALLLAGSRVGAQDHARRRLSLRFEGCSPRVERVVRGDLARPERRSVDLTDVGGVGVWQATLRCEGGGVQITVRPPTGRAVVNALRAVDAHDLREVLLAPLEVAPEDVPARTTTASVTPPEADALAAAGRTATPRTATPPRAWTFSLALTTRGGVGAHPWTVGLGAGAAFRGAAGFGLRVELSAERAQVEDTQLGGVSITLGGVGAMVERGIGVVTLGLGVRGGAAWVQEADPRGRSATMPWAGTVLRVGAALPVDGPWRVAVGAEGGAALVAANVRSDERVVASIGPLWAGAWIAVEVSP